MRGLALDDGAGAAAAIPALAGAFGLAAGMFVAHAMGGPSPVRLFLSATVIAVLLALGASAPRWILLGLVGWLAALGMVRRITSVVSPAGGADTLLLVEPLAMVILTVASVEQGVLQRRTVLSNAVLVLVVMELLGSLNPLQGDVLAGFAGLLFVLVPVLAFWVGRGFCDDRTMGLVLKAVGLVAIPASVYGLSQTFMGFPSWDTQWIEEAGYGALNVGGIIRPFASFSAASEYAFLVAVAIVVWVAFGLESRRRVLAALAVALLSTAVFLVASRSVIVMLVVALGLMAAAWGRLPLSWGAVGAVVLTGVLPWVAAYFGQVTRGPAYELLIHQLGGLSRPLDPDASTLGEHGRMVIEGFASIVEYPLGLGVGAITIAGAKFGTVVLDTEADPSNLAVALGLPGVMVYAIILASGFFGAYRTARRRADALSLAALGVLGVTLFRWLNGGQYAVAFLPWLVLGWMDRQQASGPTVPARR